MHDTSNINFVNSNISHSVYVSAVYFKVHKVHAPHNYITIVKTKRGNKNQEVALCCITTGEIALVITSGGGTTGTRGLSPKNYTNVNITGPQAPSVAKSPTAKATDGSEVGKNKRHGA